MSREETIQKYADDYYDNNISNNNNNKRLSRLIRVGVLFAGRARKAAPPEGGCGIGEGTQFSWICPHGVILSLVMRAALGTCRDPDASLRSQPASFGYVMKRGYADPWAVKQLHNRRPLLPAIMYLYICEPPAPARVLDTILPLLPASRHMKARAPL